jgi:hypothetical protein
MDWDLAITRNSKALKGIIDVLFALLGLDGSDAAQRIPRSLHSAVLGMLRPAESAVRRLIVVAARNVVVTLAPLRPRPERAKPAAPQGKVGGAPRSPAFPLFDPRKRLKFARVNRRKFPRVMPRIRFIDYDPRVVALWPKPRPVVEPPPPPDGLTSATRLHRRLQAVKLALDDLPRQARRLVRLQQRRAANPDLAPDLKFKPPLRPGRPPGYRRKPVHEVDEVLSECDWLACQAVKYSPDTS